MAWPLGRGDLKEDDSAAATAQEKASEEALDILENQKIHGKMAC